MMDFDPYRLLGLTLIPTLLGGLLSAVNETIHDKEYLKKPYSFFVWRSLLGIVGTSGVLLILECTKGFSPSEDISFLTYLVCLCLVSGFFTDKLLPLIERFLVSEIMKRMKEVEKKADECTNEIDKRGLKADAITSAQVVLAETDSAIVDLLHAAHQLENIKASFPLDRSIHIYLGRVYRKLKNYDQAISVLRCFIASIESDAIASSSQKSDIADALYNVACYHTLKADSVKNNGIQGEIDRLAHEALDTLRESLLISNCNLDDAESDADFKLLREKYKDEYDSVLNKVRKNK